MSEPEYMEDNHAWCVERETCHHCEDGVVRQAWERNSFGYYAGRYCDKCWTKSGYRDATDPDAEFDESYAGESLHGEQDY